MSGREGYANLTCSNSISPLKLGNIVPFEFSASISGARLIVSSILDAASDASVKCFSSGRATPKALVAPVPSEQSPYRERNSGASNGETFCNALFNPELFGSA
ncbi:guanine nucleotide-binding protein G(I)/G(S)/G(O)subunit gamma-2 [Striga asiatica]|uniref:Guanine nucleotide-binding protein G(I)/G(S)/G(O)subunit gamma-2 n=1 Tax=Striga asiatica TaxID=4170 RepID=A0A5A7NXA9_STRAF|nr:guanine nucleotide-binding protein G(I)/G(S)/G(O)subunit gamma-2 [Striga asiatica]